MSEDGAKTPGFESTSQRLDFNRAIIEEFRANGGRCGGRFEGNPMILLNMRGAKSGRDLTTPLSYCSDGDDCIVFASAVGENSLVYASDWPHWDHEYPESVEHLWGREDLSESQKRAILADNARAMYGFSDNRAG